MVVGGPLEHEVVADLLRRERFDEALAWLYEQADRAPADAAINRAISVVRDKMAEASLARLGSGLSRVVRGSDAEPQGLGADEAYLLSLVDGERSLDELVRASTLGRRHTARVLGWLVEHGHARIQTSAESVSPIGTARPQATKVIVGDGSATQASLLRTMLRVTLGRAVQLESASTADALYRLAREGALLVVVDFRLPGAGDALEILRQMRSEPAAASTPAIVVVQRIEQDYVRARLPAQTTLLARPVERGALEAALRSVAPRALDAAQEGT